jgi:hypothetical protein
METHLSKARKDHTFPLKIRHEQSMLDGSQLQSMLNLRFYFFQQLAFQGSFAPSNKTLKLFLKF